MYRYRVYNLHKDNTLCYLRSSYQNNIRIKNILASISMSTSEYHYIHQFLNLLCNYIIVVKQQISFSTPKPIQGNKSQGAFCPQKITMNIFIERMSKQNCHF